ncbi:MAG: hypothetical protein VKK03_02090 [Synechococcus sp.]|nr:hypothetical protein [Synechococcus sp.]
MFVQLSGSEQCAIAPIATGVQLINTDDNEIGGAMTADTPPEPC